MKSIFRDRFDPDYFIFRWETVAIPALAAVREGQGARTTAVVASDRPDPGLKAMIFGPFSGA
jgi:hypothetical protein